MRSALRSLEEFAKANGTKRKWIAVLKAFFNKAWPNVSKHTYVSIQGIVNGNIGTLHDECLQFVFLHWAGKLRTVSARSTSFLMIGVEDVSGLQIIGGLMVRGGARECNARKISIFHDIVDRSQQIMLCF
jgi:hypothetical protein